MWPTCRASKQKNRDPNSLLSDSSAHIPTHYYLQSKKWPESREHCSLWDLFWFYSYQNTPIWDCSQSWFFCQVVRQAYPLPVEYLYVGLFIYNTRESSEAVNWGKLAAKSIFYQLPAVQFYTNLTSLSIARVFQEQAVIRFPNLMSNALQIEHCQ